MMEFNRDYLQQKRAGYIKQIDLLTGAIAALDEMEAELFPPEALTMDQLKQITGAQEVGEPEAVKGGEA